MNRLLWEGWLKFQVLPTHIAPLHKYSPPQFLLLFQCTSVYGCIYMNWHIKYKSLQVFFCITMTGMSSWQASTMKAGQTGNLTSLGTGTLWITVLTEISLVSKLFPKWSRWRPHSLENWCSRCSTYINNGYCFETHANYKTIWYWYFWFGRPPCCVANVQFKYYPYFLHREGIGVSWGVPRGLSNQNIHWYFQRGGEGIRKNPFQLEGMGRYFLELHNKFH